ncbi:UNVERIFIED_CONTAM: Monothiol glutaredoxin-S17 [Sesamum radiatum]|uniref:Monothiol glutaredoxin-S17 n=1 Tax=Sesamum radiatum TaxID=300843 RepID=A0AAW2KHK7_SESRA
MYVITRPGLTAWVELILLQDYLDSSGSDTDESISISEERKMIICSCNFAHRTTSLLVLFLLLTDSTFYNLSSGNFLALSHRDENPAHPRCIIVMDDIFCIFSGALYNTCDLRRHYGLSRQATEAMIIIEAYKVLRDRAPYPPDQVVNELEGKFAFILFDSKTSTLFLARDRDGCVQLHWGTAADGSLVCTDDPNVISAACGKCYTPFPPGPQYRFALTSRVPLYSGEISARNLLDSMAAAGGGAVKDVKSKAELEATIAQGAPVVLHFWASWCEASKHMDQVFSHLSIDFPLARFLRVEAEEQPEISEAYSVSAVPYFVLFKDGKAVDTLEGADPSSLANKVAKVAGSISTGEPAAPASLGMAAGPTVLETVKELAKENGASPRPIRLPSGTGDELKRDFSSLLILIQSCSS